MGVYCNIYFGQKKIWNEASLCPLNTVKKKNASFNSEETQSLFWAKKHAKVGLHRKYNYLCYTYFL